ncbi:uncharacterized protein [Ranitomeya imitator]|uniref:uncharacterized protein isoform X2 n=1 Tax=Ranitomeya imitator TaxID=111125 RepID=UPI0037E735B2
MGSTQVLPSTLQIINLSDYVLSPAEHSVLRRGLSFSPTRTTDKFDLIKDLYLFCRKLVLQVIHQRSEVIQTSSIGDQQVLQDLLDLLVENTTPAAVFLDLRISTEGNRLVTDLFRKPTATNSLLQYQSFHPQHTRMGIPTGQFLRVRRNCTTDESFRQQARDLSLRFQQRGYPRRVISKAFQRAQSSDQASLLVSRPRLQDSTVRFITEYSTNWNQRILLNERGGDRHRWLLQHEARWIFRLKSTSPFGLNEELLYTGFLG